MSVTYLDLKENKSKNNPLAIKMPRLISDFNSSKNMVSLNQVSYSSNKKIWWLCSKGREWRENVGNRYRGTGCPYFGLKKISSGNNLAIKCPRLVAEWHPIKNGELAPDAISARGKTKVWWLCKNGHEWQATTGNRFMGTGCPFCEGRKLSSEHNLQVKNPCLANQWHPKKNENLTPLDVTPKSSKKVWWICQRKHSWQARIGARSLGQGCPYCLGRKASKTNNLAEKFPQLIPEWHDGKNELSPWNITPGSNMKVWWKCRWKHEWLASIHSRSQGYGCPKCNFRSSKLEVRIFCELKYFFSDAMWQSKIFGREVDILIPSCNLAIEIDGWYWHRTEERINSDLRKSLLLEKSGIHLLRIVDQRASDLENTHVVWYKSGENDYDIIVRIMNYLINTFNLSKLLLNKIKECFKIHSYKNEKQYYSILHALPGPELKNSVASNPLLLSEWNFTKNSLSPEQFSYGSSEKIWWTCKNKHEWVATIGSRSAGRNCPFCCGKKASIENNLLMKNPALANEWHPTKNGLITPDKTLSKSNKKVWWICKNGHEWQASVDNRSKGTGCPDCSGKRLSKNHNLAVKYPELALQWHIEKNYPLTPMEVTPKSFKKVWWKCEKGHEWQTAVEKRTRGSRCHFCSGYIKNENI